MDELIAFLRRMLDADEARARAATPGPWRHNPDKHWRKPGTSWFEEAVFAGAPGADATCVAGTGETDDPQSMADADHIARHDPARVLADVAAKRAILNAAVMLLVDDAEDEEAAEIVKNLALPYADHPDYQESWRP
jgi:hypothetical protein